MKIVIYTKKKCPYCKYAKDWLKNYQLKYTEVSLDDDTKRELFYIENHVNTVPQVFIDNYRVGGYTDLLQRHDIAFDNSPSTSPSKTYKPFKFDWAYEIRTNHENNMHWHEGEVDLSDDILDWKSRKLSDNEKDFIVNILRLFTQSDVAVGSIYFDKFIPKFKNNEIRNMLSSFATRETIHQSAYALLNDTLGLPDEEYHTFLEYSQMTDKLDFMLDSDPNTIDGLALALAKSVFNEGVTLFASFAMLLNFQRFGKMKGMGTVVEWSIRDEDCVDGKTEVLTRNGWLRIDELQEGIEIAQFHENDRTIDFVVPSKIIKKHYNGTMYEFDNEHYNLLCTENHKILYYDKDNKPQKCSAKCFIDSVDNKIPTPDGFISSKTNTGIIEREWNDYVYCVTVPTHNFVMRRNDKVSITGNCHVNGLAKLFRTFCNEHPHIVNDEFKKKIYEMARKVYELESKFIDLAFKNYTIQGLTKEEAKDYVKFITDRRLIELGLKPNFKQKTNPIEWVDWIVNGSDHSNFFEKRVTEYDSHGLTGEWESAYDNWND